MPRLSSLNLWPRRSTQPRDKPLLPNWGKGSVKSSQLGRTWYSPPENALTFDPEAVLNSFASLPLEAVLDHLQTAANGLTDLDADARLQVKGANTLPSQHSPSKLLLLLKVIPNPFNILLLALAIVNASIPPPDWVSHTKRPCVISFN